MTQNFTCMTGIFCLFVGFFWSGLCICQLKTHKVCALASGQKPDFQTLSCVHRKFIYYNVIYLFFLAALCKHVNIMARGVAASDKIQL